MDIVNVINGCKIKNSKQQLEFYNNFYGVILNTCKKYLPNRLDAEDVTQETFMKVLDRIDSFQGGTKGQLLAWIRMVSKNATIDSIRKRKLDVINIDFIENIDDKLLDNIEITSKYNVDSSEVELAISKLPPQYKKVFELYHLMECSHDEIANELGININTSKSNLCRARKILVRLLGKNNN